MTLNKILKGVTLVTVFSVFLIPFLVANDLFFPFITGKGFFFRTIVEIGFGAWLLLSMRDVSVRPRKSILFWAFGAFMVIIALADLFGANVWKSFWSNFERMEGYITLLHLFMYFIVASSTLATEKMWKRFFEASVWSSLCVSVYALFQLAGKININQGGVRVDATFGNATYLAIFLIFNIFFALILTIKDSVMWKRISYGLIAILHVIILYHTATRGAVLGLIGGLMLSGILIAIFNKGEKKLRIAAGSIVGVIILVVAGFLAIKDAEFVQKSPVLSRFASISWNETKTQARSYIWPMAIEGWKERPILGWGQENFNYIFNKRYEPKMWTQEQWFDHTHNIVLDWLVAGGILGLLAYLSIFVTAIYLLWKKAAEMSFTEKALFTGLGAAYFFHNLFVFDNIVSYVLFVSILAFIHYKATRLAQPIASSAEEMDDSDSRMAAPIILVAVFAGLYFFVWRGYATATSLITALRATSVQPVQADIALEGFRKALSYDTLGRPEVVERIVEATRAMNSQGVALETRQKFYELAKDAVDTQVKRYEGDARYEVFAAGFYNSYGQPAEAEAHLLKAVELSPKKQTILFQLGALYASQKQYDKALEVFRKTYELDPTYPDAARFYAAALVYTGKPAEAEKVLTDSGFEGSAREDALVGAYVDIGAWEKVIPVMRARFDADKKSYQNGMNLVAAYFQSGNRAGAVSVLREMIAANPDFKAEGEKYISEIQAQQ